MAQAQQEFEDAHAAELATTIDAEFGGFSQATAPGSTGAESTEQEIASLGPAAFRTSLLAALRDYQIRNNRHVLAARRDTRLRPKAAGLIMEPS